MANSPLKKYGYIWHNENGFWTTKVDEKYEATAWEFGDRFQCVVQVTNLNDPKKEKVSLGLEMNDSLDKAMKHCLDFIETHRNTTPPNAEEMILKTHKDWPHLYKYRHQLLNQIFFVGGNDYDWLDGRIVSNSPEEDHKTWTMKQEPIFEEETSKELISLVEDLLNSNPENEEIKDLANNILCAAKSQQEHIKEQQTLKKKVPFKEGNSSSPINFSNISEYSKIWTVPTDITDDWLAICAEAILLLKQRNSNENNEGQADLLIKHYVALFGERFIHLLK